MCRDAKVSCLARMSHYIMKLYTVVARRAVELEGSEVPNAAAAAVLATEWTRDAWLPMWLFT